MGAEASVPQPGTKFRVIGAGLPRTGTASFSAALEILLDGPVYHGGTQTTVGPETEVKSWIKLLSIWPPTTKAEKTLTCDIIARRMDGFAACTDAPMAQLVPEMLDLYPDALVVCTVRDAESWVKSMATVSNASTMSFLYLIFLPLPSLRHFTDYIDRLRNQWIALYGEREPVTRQTYDRHIEWLKQNVPEDRLVFYDVKDGWSPLCKALGKEVPKDADFPRINDSKAIDDFARRQILRGLTRWACIIATPVIAAAAVTMLRRGTWK